MSTETATQPRKGKGTRYWEAECTVTEAAAILAVSSRTFIRILDQGLIPFTRPNSHRRIRRADVLAYKQQRTGVGAPAILHDLGKDDPLR